MLSESTLTFQVLEIAQGLEAAERNAREIQGCGKHGVRGALGSPAEDLHQMLTSESGDGLV